MGDIIALRSADAKTPPEGGVSTSNRCEQHGKCVSLSFRWAVRVKAIGSGYWRIVGEAQDLIAWAERLHQRWIKGIGLANALEKKD